MLQKRKITSPPNECRNIPFCDCWIKLVTALPHCVTLIPAVFRHFQIENVSKGILVVTYRKMKGEHRKKVVSTILFSVKNVRISIVEFVSEQ